jgi:hydrogenase maturation protease
LNNSANKTGRPSNLVIGYGNLLRGDDGVGWHVVEELKARRANLSMEVVACQQLLPELAERISRAGTVWFVDATGVGVPGEWSCQQLTEESTDSALRHYASPGELLAVTHGLYGVAPCAYLFTVCGDSFEYGEELSVAVAAAVPSVVLTIEDLLAAQESRARLTEIPLDERR